MDNIVTAISNIFTFHYASTLSLVCPRSCPPMSNLHSTMLLLYHIQSKLVGIFNLIYIPLCFYFIVSTLPYRKQRHTHLHSTMLLLYQSYYAGYTIINTHLHSTMLLLYLILRILAPREVPDLHSTMLLLYRIQSARRNHRHGSFTFHYASTLSPAG